MILHISQDDKFLDNAIQIFEGIAPDRNKYVVWKQPKENFPSFFQYLRVNAKHEISSFFTFKSATQENPVYVKEKSVKIEYVIFGSKTFFKSIGDLTNYEAIVFHSLIYNHARIAKKICKKINIPLIWIPFGYEVYNMLPEFKNKLYQQLTNRHIKNDTSLLIKTMALIDLQKSKTIKKAIQMVNYCAISIKDEYQLYERELELTAKQLWFTYYPLEEIISLDTQTISGQNILVGNSSFPSNNHFDAFELLSKNELTGRKIIAPLSYGDEKYAKAVEKEGIARFGDRFHALKEFMPIEKYNTIIASCNVVIMNQNRQQAFGNILAAIWFGAKVFLNPQNTILSYLKGLGIKIYSLEQLMNNSSPNALSGLPEEDIAENRAILKREYSKKNVLFQAKKIITEIENFQKH